MTQLDPWHDTEMHACGGPITPVYDDSPVMAPDPRHVCCLFCGTDWLEEDVRKLARIWWSRGAYEGFMVMEMRGGAS